MAVDDLRSGTWVTYIGGHATGMRVRRCRLEVIEGPDAGLTCELEASLIRVGGRRGSELQLSDAKVSGLHFEVRLDERGYRLCDQDSTNGTFVSGFRVNDLYILPGTIIHAGDSKLRFDPLDESVEMPLSASDRFGGMVGRSVKMRELFARLDRLARIDATVLISGETGVGKELVAESLHDLSPRVKGAFEVLDCSAIPESLIESQLFGHERGSFTGATNTYAGVFERADKGTVFLDEIGELPLNMQPKLLRVLERREVRRIGSTRTIGVDIRVVAATNRDLGVEVNRGRFREDLYYRLAVARVHVPPLREHREDIPLLVEHILANLPGGDQAHLSAETVQLMMRHDWPGNVRELRNVIERAVYLSEAPSSVDALGWNQIPRPPMARPSPAQDPALNPVPGPARPAVVGQVTAGQAGHASRPLSMPVDISVPYKVAKQHLMNEFERRYISDLLAAHGGNVSRAARAAGIDRMSIHKILNRLDMENPGRE